MFSEAEESICAVIEKSMRFSVAPNSADTLVLTTRVAELENQYQVALENVAALETRLAQKDSDVAILETNLVKKDNELHTTLQKVEELKKILAEKHRHIETLEEKIMSLNEEMTKVASAPKTHVPEILEEMNNIYSTLNNVSEEVKMLTTKSKPKTAKK